MIDKKILYNKERNPSFFLLSRAKPRTRKGNIMIKENQKYFNRLHVVIDAVVIYGSFCFSYYIRFKNHFTRYLFGLFLPPVSFYRELPQYQSMLLVLVPVYLLLYAKFNLYKPKRFQNQSTEYKNLIQANTCGILFLFIYIFFMKIEHVPRSLIATFYIISMAATLLERFLIRAFCREPAGAVTT